MKRSILYGVLLAIIYFAFISLGLPDTVLGIAWPYMRVEFAKPLAAAGILTILGTIFTATSSILSGHVLNRFGTGRVTAVSCLMTATGLLGYSIAPSFLWLLPCIPLLGFGAGAIDCGLNFYIAANYSSRHMNWLHCCWGIGATFGPAIMTALIAGGSGWRSGYRTISIIQFTLSIVLFLAIGLWDRVKGERRNAESENDSVKDAETDTLTPEAVERRRNRAIRLQIGIYAIYTSCEFLVGLWAFSLLTKERGIDAVTAGTWVSLYYAALTVARFANGFIVDRLGNRFMIKTGLIVALAGACLFAFRFFFPSAPACIELVGLILLGAGFGPIYPCMTHETARRFRADTAQKVMGYQTGAANLGGAGFPALVGLIAGKTSLEILPFTLGLFVAATLAMTIALDRATAKGRV